MNELITAYIYRLDNNEIFDIVKSFDKQKIDVHFKNLYLNNKLWGNIKFSIKFDSKDGLFNFGNADFTNLGK